MARTLVPTSTSTSNLVTVTRQGLPMRPNNNFVRKKSPSLNSVTPDQLKNRVEKCQIFFTDQDRQTRYMYPSYPWHFATLLKKWWPGSSSRTAKLWQLEVIIQLNVSSAKNYRSLAPWRWRWSSLSSVSPWSKTRPWRRLSTTWLRPNTSITWSRLKARLKWEKVLKKNFFS